MVDDDFIRHLPRRRLDHARGFNRLRWGSVDMGSWNKAALCHTLSTFTRHPRGFSVPEKILKLRPGLIRKVLCSQSRKILFVSSRPYLTVPSAETREVHSNSRGLARSAGDISRGRRHTPSGLPTGRDVCTVLVSECGAKRFEKGLNQSLSGRKSKPFGLCGMRTWGMHVNMLTCTHSRHGASWHPTWLYRAV